ncbi:MAG: hypothetical protein IT380_29785, partial [Myxococcales bacterium]|nr:hypothetical protein [Myxococcales bacterium]
LTCLLAACQVESCRAQDVGEGVARLTVRNAGALTRLVDRDTTCGFASAAVLAAPRLEGATGGPGTATWTVTGCALSFPEPTAALSACDGVETKVAGRVVVSGTRTVKGTLTGNPENPIIPGEPDAVQLTLEASFEGFVARRPDSQSALTLERGSLSWVAQPRLAVSASKGVCAVATPNVAFSDVRYGASTVTVESNGRRFSVDVAGSRFDAQAGKRGERENWLQGEVTVFGRAVQFPVPGEEPLLDPDYEAGRFASSWACTADLKQPVDFACPSLRDRVAQGAARMTVKLFGRLADLFDEDTSCGFASPAVLASPVLTGAVGERGGTATWTVAGCTRTFSLPTAVDTDCLGVDTFLTGAVTARGTRTVTGLRTGDPSQPIIPTSRDPGQADLTFELSDLRLGDSAGATALTARSGSLSGRISTRTGLDSATGACSLKTSVAELTQLAWDRAALVLESDGNTFPLTVSSSRIDAQSGSKNGRENFIAGTLRVDGADVAVQPVLDPSYDAARFEASYACAPGLVLGSSDEDCAFTRPLALGAARLLVQTVGTLGALVNRDTSCGFDATLVKLRPHQVVGNPGEPGSMSWRIEGCQLGEAAPLQVDRDCLGTRRMLGGVASVDATRTVEGLRERKLLFVDSIVPTTRRAVTVELGPVQVNELASYTLPVGANVPTARLTLHSGTLSAVVRPVLGERASAPGTFDLPTPVAQFSEVQLTGARVTLESGAKRFVFSIPTARLDAFNGTYLGASNSLSGQVEVDGARVDLGLLPLNPDFQQPAFDSSYGCTEDLRSVVPAAGP